MKIKDLDKILDPKDYSWIKVKHKDFEFKDNPDNHIEKLIWNDMVKHHIEETEFLINKCRELAAHAKELAIRYGCCTDDRLPK